jgi:hypothetical protein
VRSCEGLEQVSFEALMASEGELSVVTIESLNRGVVYGPT